MSNMREKKDSKVMEEMRHRENVGHEDRVQSP